MTLDRLRPIANRLLAPFVRLSVTLGLTPNAVSVVAFVLAIGAAITFYRGGRWYVVGAVLVFFNGWLDLLDGALARELGIDSAAGDLLDHVLDRYADIVILAGLAAGVDAYAIGFFAVSGVLMTSYLGTQAEAVGLDRVYGGAIGRADRLALVGVVGFLAPFAPPLAGRSIVVWLLVLLGVAGHVTAIQRFYYAWRTLE